MCPNRPHLVWDVVIDPRGAARRFQVPDEGLYPFMRSLAASGANDIGISNGYEAFRIIRVSRRRPGGIDRVAEPRDERTSPPR